MSSIGQFEARIDLYREDSLVMNLYEEALALREQLAALQKQADKFDDGIDWIQRAMQAEAKLDCLGEDLQTLNLADPAVQKRLVAQWGYSLVHKSEF